MKISGIYKITNTITCDFYIGSSKNVKQRWAVHKRKSTWKRYSNSPLYLDMRKYGIENFDFQILAEVEEGKLKETEQKFIELLNPTYNNYNASGFDFERRKEYKKEHDNKYNNQLCNYNGQTITLCALRRYFESNARSKKIFIIK